MVESTIQKILKIKSEQDEEFASIVKTFKDPIDERFIFDEE